MKIRATAVPFKRECASDQLNKSVRGRFWFIDLILGYLRKKKNHAR